ncbi:ribosome small subunit-dependent GTPase A [Streptomyces pinistramenti]|uniref:ribosome small subunit-dependent GTPase A n=1 Tax=Streptomyces pinistramenti TaxID=2884812 RepID=UPI001D06D90A|nr:ribosome small subunit-dependent GTPase A [Streptomyces pinistramenti]MCB5912109.1 ribosome small subunit-dependent GTPase A [Streptomyces pinistramenti]
MNFPSASSDASTHALSSYGWDDGFAQSFLPHTGQGSVPGRIIRVDRGRVDAVVAEGDSVRTVLADTAPVATGDPMRVPCTGDWALIDLENGLSGDHVDGVVRALLPRRTAFVRSTSSKRSEGQVLAANVDTIVICVSLADHLDLGRIERFLALALSGSGAQGPGRPELSWDGGAQPLVVLTKADLVDDPDGVGHLVADAAGTAPGVQVLAVSAESGDGMDVLAAVLSGGTSVLVGRSGAGKSTLANALAGKAVQDVRAIRDRDGKGRHTTTTRDLLPLASGGVLIDTPGLRGVGMWDAQDGLSRTFSDVEELARECRFHDCAHETEPGCAVLAAVDDGALPQRRLDSYRKLLRENQRIVAKTDARLRAAIRRDWRQKQALGRHMMERKRGPRG